MDPPSPARPRLDPRLRDRIPTLTEVVDASGASPVPMQPADSTAHGDPRVDAAVEWALAQCRQRLDPVLRQIVAASVAQALKADRAADPRPTDGETGKPPGIPQ